MVHRRADLGPNRMPKEHIHVALQIGLQQLLYRRSDPVNDRKQIA